MKQRTHLLSSATIHLLAAAFFGAGVPVDAFGSVEFSYFSVSASVYADATTLGGSSDPVQLSEHDGTVGNVAESVTANSDRSSASASVSMSLGATRYHAQLQISGSDDELSRAHTYTQIPGRGPNTVAFNLDAPAIVSIHVDIDEQVAGGASLDNFTSRVRFGCPGINVLFVDEGPQSTTRQLALSAGTYCFQTLLHFNGGTISPSSYSGLVEVVADIVPCASISPATEDIGSPQSGTLSCGTTTQTGPIDAKWGRYGDRRELLFDSGEMLSLECVPDAVPRFELTYTSSVGARYLVGICPFAGGCNSLYFHHTGDANGNCHPDSFVGAAWLSRDHDTNDVPNPWTMEQTESPELLDHAITTSIADSQGIAIQQWEEKFQYSGSTFIPTCTLPEPRGAKVSSEPRGTASSGGSNFAGGSLQSSSTPAPMLVSSRPSCDFTGDEICDQSDADAIAPLVGTCAGDLSFDFVADRDLDGCITSTDQQLIPEPSGLHVYSILFAALGMFAAGRRAREDCG